MLSITIYQEQLSVSASWHSRLRLLQIEIFEHIANVMMVDASTNHWKLFLNRTHSTMVKKRTDHKFSLVLPVLFYEYLAISITKSLLPKMILDYYGNWSYLAVGIIETAKGCLAFLSCPIFGRLSDRIGRKYCLLATVIGTTLPVCMMAFTDNMIVYAVMMSLSGFFRWEYWWLYHWHSTETKLQIFDSLIWYARLIKYED